MKKKVNLHAGHNKQNSIACGAVSILDESAEARVIRKKVAALLQDKGVTVYNCTINDGKSASDVLTRICRKCNDHTVDLDVSLHLNSGRGDKKGDGKIGGTEVLMTSKAGIKKSAGTAICKNMEKIGFTNRGLKVRNDLYYLNHTKAPAILIEICFVDDKDDAKLYNKNKDVIAEAIANGILKALG